MRLLYSFILFVSMVFSAKQKDNFYNKALLPTFQITNEQKKASGTGIIFKSYSLDNKYYINIALSCEHVISNNVTCHYFEYSEKKFCTKKTNFESACLFKDEQDDISVIAFLSEKKLPCVDLSFTSELDLLQNVYAVGCGLSENPRFSEGKITGLNKKDNAIESIRTTIQIVPGDSGCGLYNTENKVIGISNHIKKLDYNGISYPIEGISVFKPLELYKNKMDKKLSDELFNRNPDTQLFSDFLWLLDAEYKI